MRKKLIKSKTIQILQRTILAFPFQSFQNKVENVGYFEFKNINGIQVYTGELEDIQKLYPIAKSSNKDFIISKEHPAFNHYTGSKDEREWMFPTVTGYYPSFFSYWKKCQANLTN